MNETFWAVLWCASIILTGLTSATYSALTRNGVWEASAIRANVAYYDCDATTSKCKFTWKVNTDG